MKTYLVSNSIGHVMRPQVALHCLLYVSFAPELSGLESLTHKRVSNYHHRQLEEAVEFLC